MRPAYCPVPESETVCGDAPPVSVMFSVALRAPVAFGEKNTSVVQLVPAPRVVPQALTSVKSRLSAPVTEILVMFTFELP